MSDKPLTDREYLNRYSLTVAEYIDILLKMPQNARILCNHSEYELQYSFASKPYLTFVRIRDNRWLDNWYPEDKKENESESIFQIVRV